MSPIVVTFYAPPIPWRGADYCATREGYDYLDPLGYGETEAGAVEALLEMEGAVWLGQFEVKGKK